MPGQLDNDKADALCSMLSATVEVQNPAVCFRGSSKSVSSTSPFKLFSVEYLDELSGFNLEITLLFYVERTLKTLQN